MLPQMVGMAFTTLVSISGSIYHYKKKSKAGDLCMAGSCILEQCINLSMAGSTVEYTEAGAEIVASVAEIVCTCSMLARNSNTSKPTQSQNLTRNLIDLRLLHNNLVIPSHSTKCVVPASQNSSNNLQ